MNFYCFKAFFMFCLMLILGVLPVSAGEFKIDQKSKDRQVEALHKNRMPITEPIGENGSATVDYMAYLKHVCEDYKVPFTLMKAIIDHESRFHIWALNVEGKGYLLRTKAEALKIIAESRGKSFDVGLMQINVQWLRKFGIRAEDAIEPHVNIILGVYIMNENLIAYGPTWQGVAAYHTPPGKNPYRAVEYAKKIWERYKRFETAR